MKKSSRFHLSLQWRKRNNFKERKTNLNCKASKPRRLQRGHADTTRVYFTALSTHAFVAGCLRYCRMEHLERSTLKNRNPTRFWKSLRKLSNFLRSPENMVILASIVSRDTVKHDVILWYYHRLKWPHQKSDSPTYSSRKCPKQRA